MKLILHLVRNDLWRLRAWLAAGIGMLLAMEGIGVALLYWPAGDPGRNTSGWNVLGEIPDSLVAGEIVLAYVLVLLLVQGDRLIGTTAFWRTRPIAVERLLAAKFLAAAVILVGIPTLVLLPWWLWCGFGLGEIFRAIRALVVIAILVGGPAALVAALADSIGRAILWGVVVVPLSGGVAMGSLMAYGLPAEARYAPAGLLALPVVLVLVTAVYVLFLGPRGRIVGIIAVVLLAWAPAEWTSSRGGSEHWDVDAARAQPVGIAIGRATTERTRMAGEVRDQIVIGFEPRDVPPGTVLTGGFADLTWSLANGVVTSRRGTVAMSPPVAQALGLHAPAPDAETQQWVKQRTEELKEQRARQGLPTPHWLPRVSGPSVFAFLPLSISASMTRSAPHFEGVFHLRLMRPRIVNEVPATEPSGWRAGSGVGFRIMATEHARGARRIGIVDSRPIDIVADSRREYSVAGVRSYLVVQPATQEILMGGGSYGRRVAIGFVSLRRTWFEASMPRVRRGDAWVQPEQDTYAGAVLAQVILEEEARFTRAVTSDALKVESLNPPPSPPAEAGK